MTRIGVVGFLNTLPLAYGLEHQVPRSLVSRATPAQVADDLLAGKLDVGLIPVAALAGRPEWPVVPGLGIASRGPVRSVVLLSRVPVEAVTRLVLDPASRTSNVLARLWLRRTTGTDPEVTAGPPEPRARLAQGEATVVIGDDALFWKGDVPHRVDLGRAWTAWTGFPFVYAVWAGPGAADPELARGLADCYRGNAARLGDLAAAAFPGDPERREETERYLRENIRYVLGAEENRGLRRFLELGAEAGFFPPRKMEVGHVHAG